MIFGTVVIFLGCQGGVVSDACEEHFDLQNIINAEIQRVERDISQGIKIIKAGEHRDTIELSREYLIGYIRDLSEFDINLPNLLGRYSCDYSVSEETAKKELRTYIAVDERLPVREFRVEFVENGEGLFNIYASKEVGSILATVEKSLYWSPGNSFFEIEVEYFNIFGRTRNYLVRIKY